MKIFIGILDKIYIVTVERTEPYRGVLKITEGAELKYETPVTIMYDAKFGADVDDVSEWMEIAMEWVDSQHL